MGTGNLALLLLDWASNLMGIWTYTNWKIFSRRSKKSGKNSSSYIVSYDSVSDMRGAVAYMFVYLEHTEQNRPLLNRHSQLLLEVVIRKKELKSEKNCQCLMRKKGAIISQ